jgi:hypothetical protein
VATAPGRAFLGFRALLRDPSGDVYAPDPVFAAQEKCGERTSPN